MPFAVISMSLENRFERIFRLRNPENPDFPIAMTLQNAPNPTHFYFLEVKFGDFLGKSVISADFLTRVSQIRSSEFDQIELNSFEF